MMSVATWFGLGRSPREVAIDGPIEVALTLKLAIYQVISVTHQEVAP